MSLRGLTALLLPGFLFCLPSPALSDLSLVLDVDSDYTNGPDTLSVANGDTITAEIWLVGADTVAAFGITVGDYSQILRWLPEPQDSLYTVPGAWSPGDPVPTVDSSSVLLQAADFSFSSPIQADAQVARVRFVVQLPGVCTPIIFDLENSAWFNLDAGENAFTSGTEVSVCAPRSPGITDSLRTWGSIREVNVQE